MRIILKFTLFVSLFILLSSCKKTTNKSKNITDSKHLTENQITYAKGFKLYQYPTYKKLEILHSFKEDSHSETFYLVPKSQTIPDSLKRKAIIKVPIEQIVVSSTTHIPMLEILGVENTLVGFPNTQYISSKKTRALIDANKITDLGQNQNINTELLIDLKPELVVAFGINNMGKTYESIKKMGIPVIFNGDWLEKTPLGRAEWLRFFGALYHKDSLAETKFKEIEQHYNSLKNQVSNEPKSPTILSGALFQDTWHLPAGESYMATFFNDAHGSYIWKDTKGTGSLSLSLESVLDKAKDADIWIAPGFYKSKKEMKNTSPHYTEFNAFKNNNVYSYASKTGVTGGVLYFELATTRPDLVLKDLVKIIHPQLLAEHQLYFFEKLN